MQQPRTIGVLSPLLGGFYFGDLLSRIRHVAQAHGARIVAIQTLGVGERMLSGEAFSSTLAFDLVDGWIVIVDEESALYLKQQLPPGVPMVTISLLSPELGCPSVLPDNRGGMAEAVWHLIDHGHQRIAFLGGTVQEDIRQRYEGYLEALRARGIAPDPALFVPTEDYTEHGGQVALERFLASGPQFTAIAAGNDGNAIGALEALQEAGYRVPEDVALVGFDDIDPAQYTMPPLTTVRQRLDGLGALATELVLKALSGAAIPAQPHYVNTLLVRRLSCGCGVERLELASASLAQPGWQQQLAEALVRRALAPIEPEPGVPPQVIWPGLDHFMLLLEGVLRGVNSPSPALLAELWRHGVTFTVDLEVLYSLVDLIEEAGRSWITQAGADEGAAERLRVFINRVRIELTRARLATEIDIRTHLSNTIRNNYAISIALLGSKSERARDLTWLRSTPLSWGCLGLWAEGPDMPGRQLVVVGSYSRQGEPTPPLGSRYLAPAFPPAAFLPGSVAPEAGETLLIVPLKTATRDWGALALAGPIEGRHAAGHETIRQRATMLVVALEREALLASLEQQQETMRLAYEHERALASTIRELGSPVIPLLPGVLLVPLVGTIDADRAAQFIEAVLHGVSENRARVVLIDVTGVPLVDTQVANSLIQTTRAATLLGARVILVGVRPEIAQTIVGLGIDLTHMATQPTLASALESLIRGQGLGIRG